MSGSVWDEVLGTEHATVVRTYIEQWPRKDRKPEKVLVIVVEAGEAQGMSQVCARGTARRYVSEGYPTAGPDGVAASCWAIQGSVHGVGWVGVGVGGL